MEAPAGVMELVDVVDSKSTAGDSVPVRVRSPAPQYLPLFDTIVSARVGIFISIFTYKQGLFPNFATHFHFRCPRIVLFPGVRINQMQHIVLSIR